MPTLTRLSFFLPPPQLDDFAALYDRQLLPLLQPHGLEAGFSDDRPYVAGVFSRLFAVERSSALIRTQQVLRHDPAWRNAIKGLGERLGVSLRYNLPTWSLVRHQPGVGSVRGREFAVFTTEDGLAGNQVRDILEDRQGNLWIATDGGATRYDGKTFARFTTEDGLVHNDVQGIVEDRDGVLWFHTSGGVSRYDGRVFQRLRRQDGLAHNGATGMLQDRSGDMWITTLAGVTRYRSRSEPPRIELTDVVANRRYGPVPALRLPSSQELVAFEFQGVNLTTSPDQMLYLYRLEGRDPDWRVSRDPHVEYTDLPVGDYTFQVKADELQTAHNLQMDLMPKESPRIAGLALAGRCIPANHVGGDLFQYFHHDGKLSIALADVTGHAMEAAIPMVMFSGVLHSEMRHQLPLEPLFVNLNHTLHARLDARTFVCFSMAQLDLPAHTLRLVSGGCPYPYHYRAADQQVRELQVNAYPLGVRADTCYKTIEVVLALGDYVVFCSDGIIEAGNGVGEMFGFERTGEVVRRGCAEDLSAEGLLARIIQEVKAFSGEVSQGDDQTVVVLTVER